MKVVASSRFLPRARKLKPPRSDMLRAALRRFATNPHDVLLRTHKLQGELADYRSLLVDDDLRVLFRWDDDTCFLVNLGRHDEVY